MRVRKQVVSLISVGRLFQTSGPVLTENARRLNCVLIVRRATADLVVDDRSWRWCALELNATRSLRYGGERWWKILYIDVATLKVIRNFIGSQWSCLRAGVETDNWGPRMSRAAAFWTRWRGASVDAGRPTSTLTSHKREMYVLHLSLKSEI